MGDLSGGMRPWRSRTLLASIFVVLVVAAAMSAAFGSVPPRASASPGPSPFAVGPRHEMTIGVEELQVQTTNPLQATLVDEFILWVGVYSFLFNINAGLQFEPDIAVRWQQTVANPVTYRPHRTRKGSSRPRALRQASFASGCFAKRQSAASPGSALLSAKTRSETARRSGGVTRIRRSA